MRRTIWLVLALVTAGCSRDSSKRTQEQLAGLQKRKAEEAVKNASKAATTSAPQVTHVAAPYDEGQGTMLSSDAQCPAGLWALFPGEAPGATPEEKKANEARRAGLVQTISAWSFLVRLQAPAKVTLHPHDAANGKFDIEVAGSVDCLDPAGHVTIAWTPAKAVETPASAVSQGAEVRPNLWDAPPLTFELPMKSLSEAKAFYDANRFGLSARVALKLGKGEVDKKLKKVGKVTKTMPDQTIGYGGGVEDWGAGRLVRATLVGVRVATEQERKELFDRRGPK
jgi:hypothetical protein